MKKELTSRQKRRRRRIRNQLFAYLVLIVVAAVVLAGGYFGANAVTKYIKDYNEKVNDAVAEAESNASSEMQSDPAPQEPGQEANEGDELEPDNNTPIDTDQLDVLVNKYLQNLTIEQMVAGMFMVSPESITGVQTVIQAGSGTKTALTENPVGGLYYSAKNFKSEQQFQEMLANTKNFVDYPLFLAVARECGDNKDFGIEATAKAAELTDADNVKSAYGTIAGKLAGYGINMNFAPVAEVAPAEGGAGLNERTFGSDAATAAPLVNAAVQAMQASHIYAVLQKFPSSSTVTKSLEELKNSEFVIYNTAIQNGADCIMVSHAAAKEVIGDETPSSLSSVMITDILRNTLGFQGVVITDALNDGAITSKYSSAEAVIAAIQAGADVLLEPEDYQEAYQGVLQAVADGTISKERLQASLYRIYYLKYKYTLE